MTERNRTSGTRLASSPVRCVLIALVASLVAACSPGTDHYAAILDELGVPASWELVHTTLQGHGLPDDRVDPSRSQDAIACDIGHCPAVLRYYLVEGSPAEIYPVVRRLVTSAGFGIGQETGPACDLPPGGAACDFDAARGSNTLLVVTYNPDTSSEGIGTADTRRSVVRIPSAPS